LLACLDHKTVDLSRLTGGWVLDGGCRGFGFTEALLLRGCRVVAVDPGENIHNPRMHGELHVLRKALVASPTAHVGLIGTGDPETAFTQESGGVRVLAVTIGQVMARFAITRFDVVKLNIEGGEYAILEHWPGPVADQITVSFHDFRGMTPEGFYPRMLKHLGRWYDVLQHEATERFGEVNHWDSLFVLRSS